MKILDATCGWREMWFNKNHSLTTYLDKRENDKIHPDVVADWTRELPFNKNYFDMVIFDPPHIIQNSDKGFMVEKYGRLSPSNWRQTIQKGFKELFRVLKPNGVFILKWCETNKFVHSIPVSDIIKLSPYPPLIGTKTGTKTHWIVFLKYDVNKKLDEVQT